MSDRRKFLKTSSCVAAGTILLPFGCSPSEKKAEEGAAAMAEEVVEETIAKKEIGVQVYSVRDALKEDFSGSLKKLADIGYKNIEAYGLGLDGQLYGMAPTEYKKIVDDLGMKLVSSHSTYFTIEDAEKVRDAALEAGLEYVIVPYLGDDLRSDYSKIAQNLNEVGELFNKSNLKLGYHNHAFEFEKQGDKIPLEIMLDETDANLVTFQADLYWVTKGGMDPMNLINKYPGRFSSVHVKDADNDLEQTTVGTGIIDFSTLLSKETREKAGIKYYFIEDERQDDPFGNLEADFKYIDKLDIG